MDNNAYLFNTIQYDLGMGNIDEEEEDQSVDSSDLEEMPQQPQPVRHYIHQEQQQQQQPQFHVLPIQNIQKRLLEPDAMDNGMYPMYQQHVEYRSKKQKSSITFEKVFECLSIYKMNHNGDLKIPVRYVVPKNSEEYPQGMWGMKIGKTLHHIRCHSYYNEHRQRLEDLGVDFYVKRLNSVGFEVIFSALVAYKNIHGNLSIPQKFTVPTEDNRYPLDTWGLGLGQRLQSIRSCDTYSEHKERLQALGVVFLTAAEVMTVDGVQLVKKRTNTDIERIIEAIQAFRAINGHARIPKRFVVPHEDLRYPVHTWGLQLGNSVHHIRCHNTHLSARERLLALGVQFAVKTKVGYPFVLLALQAYKAVHGDVHVPKRFIVPMNDERYPHETWGLKLGNTVSNIRNAQAYSEHRAELAALGLLLRPEEL